MCLLQEEKKIVLMYLLYQYFRDNHQVPKKTGHCSLQSSKIEIPKVRPFVAGLSSWKSGFAPRPVHVEFVVDEVAFWTIQNTHTHTHQRPTDIFVPSKPLRANTADPLFYSYHPNKPTENRCILFYRPRNIF